MLDNIPGILNILSYNTSTSSGVSIVVLTLNNKKYLFKYVWKTKRPDLSLFKQYKNKEVKISTTKPDINSLSIRLDPRDYFMGKPSADLYGKRGAYIGTSEELCLDFFSDLQPLEEQKCYTPVTLYVIE